MRLAFSIIILSVFMLSACDTDNPDRVFQAIENEYGLRLGVAGLNLTTGDEIYFNADTLFPTASVIKTPVLIELYRQYEQGYLDRHDTILFDSTKVYEGSGVLRYLTVPQDVMLHDAAILMIIYSDNAGTNLVFDRLGPHHDAQLDSVNNTMRALGLEHTEMLNKPFGFDTRKDTPFARRYGIGVSTPREMTQLMQMLSEGTVVSPEASREMIDIHKNQQWTYVAPRYIQAEFPELVFAHKTGGISTARCDVGLIFSEQDTIAFAVMADMIEDDIRTVDRKGNLALAEATLEMYRRIR